MLARLHGERKYEENGNEGKNTNTSSFVAKKPNSWPVNESIASPAVV